MPKKVFLPVDINVQLGATKEHPAGRVRQLRAGWVELDEELESHPILAKLVPQTDKGKNRQERLYQAEHDRNQKISEANAEFLQVQQECQQDEIEEGAQLSEDHAKQVEEQGMKGHVVQQQHPNPEVARAQALTAQPSHILPSASLEQKPLGLEEAKKAEEALPSEQDRVDRQQQQQDTEKKNRETLDNSQDSTSTSSSGAKGGRSLK
jgi:hypothetical protein